MPRIPKGKVSLYVYLSAEVVERLRKFVEERYGGRVSGGLSREVERAILLYLGLEQRRADSGAGPAARTHTHTHVQRIGNNRTGKTLSKIVSRILDISEEEIPSTILTKIVMDVAGGDGRTVEKYMKLLLSYRIISPASTGGNGVTLYRIDTSRAREFVG